MRLSTLLLGCIAAQALGKPASPDYDSRALAEDSLEELAKRQSVGGILCPQQGGRGSGTDYDYGCTGGYCWRNCRVHSASVMSGKPWCWLKYEAGNRGWVPCGRWQDCEWSYNNKNARCATGNCDACGCDCNNDK